MICNFISGIFMDNIDFYSKDDLINIKEKVEILNEEPLTHPSNFILTWKE